MCLTTISRGKPGSTGIGYKVFKKRGRLLCGEFSTGRRQTKTWLKAGDYTDDGGASEIIGYSPGFHIFKDLCLARKWLDPGEVVRKLKYRHAYLAGESTGYSIPTVVAQEIYIYPGEVK